MTGDQMSKFPGVREAAFMSCLVKNGPGPDNKRGDNYPARMI